MTANNEHQFTGDPTAIPSIDIDAPIANVARPLCDYFFVPFGHAAAQGDGDPNGFAVYDFLRKVTTYAESFDTPNNPFIPRLQATQGISPAPADLSANDVTVIRELGKCSHNDGLKARLLDLLWTLARDRFACSEAAEAYLRLAKQLNAPDHWARSIPYYKRALYLASRLGRKKPLFETSVNDVRQAAIDAGAGKADFRCYQLMKLLLEFGEGNDYDAKVLLPLCSAMATKAREGGNLIAWHNYLDIAVDWHRATKDADGAATAELAAAEACVEDAEHRARGDRPSFTVASMMLTSGIEALRRAHAKEARIDELKARLREYQQASLSEMKVISTKVNIAEETERARNFVRSDDLTDALLKFVCIQPLLNPVKLRERVRGLAERFPMSYLLPSVLLDERGRAIALMQGMSDASEETVKLRQEEIRMFLEAARFHWPIRVRAFIDPARLEILNQHLPSYDDLFFIVKNNPFVPPGHEGIFLRGLHAGFHGDFLIASHLDVIVLVGMEPGGSLLHWVGY